MKTIMSVYQAKEASGHSAAATDYSELGLMVTLIKTYADEKSPCSIYVDDWTFYVSSWLAI